MKIEGFSEDQIAALCEMWKLGSPINVVAFLDRADIPNNSKERVRKAGKSNPLSDDATLAGAYRQMQAQIIIEVAKLDKQRWNPQAAARWGKKKQARLQ
jgi:hypothetical protein